MKRIVYFLLLFMLTLSACQVEPSEGVPADPSSTPTVEETRLPTLTPTPIPPKTLTICTNALPESLFPYDGREITSKTNLLSLLYEAPFKLVGGELRTILLNQVPTLSNGGLRLEPSPVQLGQTVVDAAGNLTVAKAGVLVRPSGCRGSTCTVVWDGVSPLEMDRMVVDFTLREDLAWSDGKDVSAADSVFSYYLAAAPEAPGTHWAEERTDGYQALDARTVQWVGKPGFTTADLNPFFWRPLPSHLLDSTSSWSELAGAEALAQSPLSYGPFMITAKAADRIKLTRNPHYWFSDEGYPLLDEVTFLQVAGGRQEAWDALKAGICDVLDASFEWESDLVLLEDIASDPRVQLQVSVGSVWEQLVFGIAPAAYDDYYNPALGDRPDFFGDPLIRQAFAFCLDRAAMAETTLVGWGEPWSSFLPPGLSQLSQEEAILYDPTQAIAILETAGWVDDDNDPQTPRIAYAVQNVSPGTELRVGLLINETPFQKDMAAVIQQSLAGCGIGVDIQSLPAAQLYAPGPEGPLFGRRFDLALISWAEGPGLDCQYYLADQIPAQGNQWIGTNIAGFSSGNFDLACNAAALALDEEKPALMQAAEAAFLADPPAVPLFSRPAIVILSSALCFDETLTDGKEIFNSLEAYVDEKNCP